MVRTSVTPVRRTHHCRICGRRLDLASRFYPHYTTRSYHSYCKPCTLAMLACRRALGWPKGIPALLRAHYGAALRIGYAGGVKPNVLGQLIALDIEKYRARK